MDDGTLLQPDIPATALDAQVLRVAFAADDAARAALGGGGGGASQAVYPDGGVYGAPLLSIAANLP
jgi:hypothetical protein